MLLTFYRVSNKICVGIFLNFVSGGKVKQHVATGGAGFLLSLVSQVGVYFFQLSTTGMCLTIGLHGLQENAATSESEDQLQVIRLCVKCSKL